MVVLSESHDFSYDRNYVAEVVRLRIADLNTMRVVIGAETSDSHDFSCDPADLLFRSRSRETSDFRSGIDA